MPVERITRFQATSFQSVSTGNRITHAPQTMGFTCHPSILRTPTGLLKILELALIISCLVLAHVGNEGKELPSGGHYNEFPTKGTLVGFAIYVPAILFSYLMGANLTILEPLINLVGCVLFITCGAICIHFHEKSNLYSKSAGIALGSLMVVTGIVFLVDFLIAVKNIRVAVVQTI